MLSTWESLLIFNYHLSNIITFITKKISRAIGLPYKLRHYVSKKDLMTMHYSLIYPFFIYNLPVHGILE